MEKNSLMKIVRVPSSNGMGERKEIYRGNLVDFHEIPQITELELSEGSLDYGYFYLVRKVESSPDNISVSERVYDLFQILLGERGLKKPTFDKYAEFPLNNGSLDKFLDIDLNPKCPKLIPCESVEE